MTNPHLTAALAEQHVAQLRRQVEQHRLVRAARARPTEPRTLIHRRGLRRLRPSTSGVAA